MRVLIVDAFASSGPGRQAFMRYEKLVRLAFQTAEAHEQGRTEILVRNYRKLEVRAGSYLQNMLGTSMERRQHLGPF